MSTNSGAALISGSVILNGNSKIIKTGDSMITYIVQDKKGFADDKSRAKRTQVFIDRKAYAAGAEVKLDEKETDTKALVGAGWIVPKDKKVPVELPGDKK